MKIIILIGALIILALVISLVYLNFSKAKKERPAYCDDNGCIPKEVFRNLPEYPSDLEEVKYLMVLSENVSKEYAEDYYYYKQPEFYTDSFLIKGIGYYTILSKPKNFTYMNVAGYGAYPAELKLNAGNSGYELTSYLHASWGVVKYQGIGLKVNYPEDLEKCLETELVPRAILLGRTYLSFDFNWAEKLKIKLKFKDCPKGNYLVTVSTTSVPRDIESEWIRIYGNGYMPLTMVKVEPFIKIFVNVV
jgi:hypothetical protein